MSNEDNTDSENSPSDEALSTEDKIMMEMAPELSTNSSNSTATETTEQYIGADVVSVSNEGVRHGAVTAQN